MTVALWLAAVRDDDSGGSFPREHHHIPPQPRGTDDAIGRDLALAAAIRAGDREAFDAWYTAHFEMSWKFAYRFVASRDVAKDIVQDVFVSFWLRRELFTPRGALRSYLFGAVRNRALHVIRQSAFAGTANEMLGDEPMFFAHQNSAAEPSGTIEAQELSRRLVTLIMGLPERQRSALILHVEHDMTASEVSRALGVSPTAATNLIRRGIANLRQGLQENNSEK